MTDTEIRDRRSLVEFGDLDVVRKKIFTRNVHEIRDCHDEKEKEKIASEINSTKLHWCRTSVHF